MDKYRNETIFGTSEMDLSDGPTWRVTTQEPNAERGRLEREVIEAAKRWVPKRGQHGTHHTARQCPTCAAERAFYKATHDLIDFDSQHGIQK